MINPDLLETAVNKTLERCEYFCMGMVCENEEFHTVINTGLFTIHEGTDCIV